MKTVVLVVGPTAVGKTALSIEIAKALNTEIVSADSRQFYREMSIGTAKPSAYELAQVKHHFIDTHSIEQPLNAGSFERQALNVIDTIFKTKDVAVVCGGSGLYLNALAFGLDQFKPVDKDIRISLNEKFASEGIVALQEELKLKDPEYYAFVDQHNHARLIRALEIIHTTGVKYSAQRKQEKKARNFNLIWIGLQQDREQLNKRIDHRVDQMLEKGLLQEVASLLPFRNLSALQTVGYQEFYSYFDGLIDLKTAIENVKTNTRRFAKRQMTWFRKNEKIQWFSPFEINEALTFLEKSI